MRYEIKKLLLRKEVWIVFGLSMIAVLLLSLRQPWVRFSTIQAAHRKTAEYYSLSLDEAELRLAQELEQSGTEAELNMLNQMQNSVKSYRVQEENMKSLLSGMYHEMEHAATDFERRDLAHAIKLYNRKVSYRLCDAKQLHIAFLWMNDFDLMHHLFLLILCTLLAPLFAVESESGMYQLVFTAKKGKKQLFRTKILGGIFCSACLALCYTALTFAVVWVKYGLSFQLLFAPIQCAEYYQNCPFSMSILQFLILTAAMRTLVGALLTAMTAIISSLFNRTAIIFGTTVGVTGVFVLLSKAFANLPDAGLFMKRLGLLRLPILGDYLTQYETVNVCGYPIEQLWLSIACTCSVVLVLLSIAHTIYTLPNKEKRKRVKICSASRN